MLSDCLQSGVIAMLTIGVHRKVTVNFMVEALNFIQNQAGVVPPRVILEGERTDEIAMAEVIQRVKLIQKAFENRGKKAVGSHNQGGGGGAAGGLKGDKISFM